MLFLSCLFLSCWWRMLACLGTNQGNIEFTWTGVSCWTVTSSKNIAWCLGATARRPEVKHRDHRSLWALLFWFFVLGWRWTAAFVGTEMGGETGSASNTALKWLFADTSLFSSRDTLGQFENVLCVRGALWPKEESRSRSCLCHRACVKDALQQLCNRALRFSNKVVI